MFGESSIVCWQMLQLPWCPSKHARGAFSKHIEKLPNSRIIFSSDNEYRVTLVVEYLGSVDLDLGRSPGWWAAIVAA